MSQVSASVTSISPGRRWGTALAVLVFGAFIVPHFVVNSAPVWAALLGAGIGSVLALNENVNRYVYRDELVRTQLRAFVGWLALYGVLLLLLAFATRASVIAFVIPVIYLTVFIVVTVVLHQRHKNTLTSRQAVERLMVGELAGAFLFGVLFGFLGVGLTLIIGGLLALGCVSRLAHDLRKTA